MTKRRVKDENYKKKVKKLSNVATFFTLIKAFVCTGCLYLPKSFINGGYGFQIISLVISCIFTMYCSTLILETRTKLKADSYTEIGEKLYGRMGRVVVDVCLILSQSGFCCAYVFFIKSNYSSIL
mmetsp:Transcript_9659/g.16232  ORF Transcript_9659/g.16232 Transcript_9659/m.16232 type:complete len:125 (+) Transcript_9659:568-942(+)